MINNDFFKSYQIIILGGLRPLMFRLLARGSSDNLLNEA